MEIGELNEDLNQEEAANIIRRSIALADATTTSDMAGTGADVPQPELTPAKSNVPAKLTDNLNLTTQIFMTLPAIDVTDGNWKGIPLWYQTKLTDYAIQPPKQELQRLVNPKEIRMDSFLGVASDLLLGTTSTDVNCRVTYSENRMDHFWTCKFKGFDITLGNFAMYIERDSSGGIQMKDDPVFEIQLVPIDNMASAGMDNPDVFGKNNYPHTTYTTNLKEGLKVHVRHEAGIEFTQRHVYIARNENNQRHYSYQTYEEWMMNSLPPRCKDTDNAKNLPARPRLLTPMYRYWVRLMNAPRGLSNWRIHLAYTAELKSYWEGHQYLEDLIGIFPEYGSAYPGNFDIKETARGGEQLTLFRSRKRFYKDLYTTDERKEKTPHRKPHREQRQALEPGLPLVAAGDKKFINDDGSSHYTT